MALTNDFEGVKVTRIDSDVIMKGVQHPNISLCLGGSETFMFNTVWRPNNNNNVSEY